MSDFNMGDLVVLTSGSMRMAVEKVDGDTVACVWCHEGIIGRDSFNTRLLKKWEHREEGGDPRGASRPYRGDREGGGKPYRAGGSSYNRAPRSDEGGGSRYRSDDGGSRGGYRKPEGEGDDRPRAKTGWDGKPREKKYFRKED